MANCLDHDEDIPCLGGEIGRRKRLKISRPNGRAGSTPARGTIEIKDLRDSPKSFFIAY